MGLVDFFFVHSTSFPWSAVCDLRTCILHADVSRQGCTQASHKGIIGMSGAALEEGLRLVRSADPPSSDFCLRGGPQAGPLPESSISACCTSGRNCLPRIRLGKGKSQLWPLCCRLPTVQFRRAKGAQDTQPCPLSRGLLCAPRGGGR